MRFLVLKAKPLKVKLTSSFEVLLCPNQEVLDKIVIKLGLRLIEV